MDVNEDGCGGSSDPADESPYENENNANENADDLDNCSLNVNEFDCVGSSSNDAMLGGSNESNETTAETINWNNLRYEEVVGKRMDCKKLIYTRDEKQMYGRNRVLKDGDIAFLCRLYGKHKCKSRLYMKNGRLYKKSDFIEHNHPNQEKDRFEFDVEYQIKNECGKIESLIKTKSNSSATSEIFNKYIKQNQSSKLSLNKIGRNLKKKSTNARPPSPKTCEEIIEAFKKEDVKANYGMTLHDGTDEDKLQSTEFFKTAYECKAFSYCVFASENILNAVKKMPVHKRRFMMDATFKIVPFGMYNQFLVIYIEHLGETTPFLYVLMSRKTRRCYEHLFKYIKKHLIDLGESKSIMTDFECAMRNALRIVFPQTELNACWFHSTQAAKKRAMQTPQLYPYLYLHKDAREIYYKLLSLPLLHPRDIIPEFQKLKVIALAKHRAVFAEFIKYFERQWILKVSDYTCCFFSWFHPLVMNIQEGPEKISVFNLWTRTTGCLEAYNGTLGKRIHSKGHFFKFIEVLLDEEFRKCRDFYSLMRGRDDKPSSRGNKYQVKSNFIH